MNKLDISPKPIANHLHNTGLVYSLNGDNESARESYFAAIAEYGEEDTPRNLVQLARILRDLGFTYVRDAIRENPVKNLGIARVTLKDSIDLFDDVYACEELDGEAYRYLLSEHGATVGLLARTATVEGLLTPDSDQSRQADRHAIDEYVTAGDFLSESDNSYYRTSNLVNAARHEAAYNRPILGLNWFSRSVGVAALSLVQDAGNAANNARTVADKARVMLRPSAARRSVLARP
jgi:hypothetical protein